MYFMGAYPLHTQEERGRKDGGKEGRKRIPLYRLYVIQVQVQARIQDFLKGGGVMAQGGGVIGGDRPCRRKITI